MATKSQEILLKGNTTNASAVPSSLKVREIAINALDRSLFTNDGNSIVKLYTGTTKWFDVNGNANNALKLGGILASEYINKEAFNSHINNSIIHITSVERTKWNNKWDYNEETIKGVKVNAAVNADYASSAGDADTLDGYHSSHFLYSPSQRDFADGTFIQTDITFGHGTIFYVEICSNGYETGIINSRFQGYMYQTSLVSCDSTHLGTSRIAGFVAMNYNDKLAFWFPRQGYWCGYRVFVSDVSDSATQYNRVISVTNSTKPSNSYEYTFSDGAINAFITSNVASATKLATARKIWGKPFDGSGDISGDLTEVGNITASGKATIQGDIISGGEVVAVAGEGTPAGVTDYSALTGKPAINGVTLVSGNNTLASLGIQAAGDYATNSGVTNLLANYADKTFVSNNYVGKSAFNNHIADTDIHITSTERTAWNSKWDYNEATIKAVKVTSASSADSVAWTGISGKPTTFTPSAHTHTASDISGLPTKLSAFTNDVGYITGITKSMVEGVLTGDITSHTHSYLPLSGGTLTGRLVCDFDGTNSSYYTWRNLRQYSGGGGRADSFIVLLKADSTFNASFGTYGSNETDSFIFVGYDQNYYGLNLRISPTSIYWGNNLILHEGNFNSYAPTLTGTGASGTWGISISGNAATADVVSKTYANQSINFSSYDSKIRLISSTSGDASENGFPISYVGGISAISIYCGWQMVTFGSSVYPNPYFRQVYDTDNYSDWKQLAFLTDNVASATKLQTPRTIWGQSFDGINDITGAPSFPSFIDINRNATTGTLIEPSILGFEIQTYVNDVRLKTYLASGVSNPSHLVLMSSGNVGIGTIEDNGYKLAVNGSERVYGDLIVDGEVSVLVA